MIDKLGVSDRPRQGLRESGSFIPPVPDSLTCRDDGGGQVVMAGNPSVQPSGFELQKAHNSSFEIQPMEVRDRSGATCSC